MASNKSTYKDLATAFRHGKFEPIYLFYGEEKYFSETLQKLVVKNAIEPHEKDFNLDIVYGAESEARAVLGLCASYPVMSTRRVVIVRDFDQLKENRLFTSYAANPNPAAVVVLVCAGKPNMNAHPYRAIRNNGIAVDFKALRDYQVPRWIEHLAKERGYSIEPQAVQMLTDLNGSSLQRAASELDKLATYTGGRDVIREEDVVQATGQTREFNVFELQRAVGEKRHVDAVRIAERLLQQSTAPQSECILIVNVLTSYFIRLWRLTECQKRRIPEKEMAKQIGVSPFYIKEYLASLRHFDIRSLGRIFTALLSADHELKGGSTRGVRLVMSLLIRRILSEPQTSVVAA